MEKILNFKGKFAVNPRIKSLNAGGPVTYYSDQSAEEDTGHETPKMQKKMIPSKFLDESGEKESKNINGIKFGIEFQKNQNYETDNSEPNTPNNDTGHKKYANNAKVSKFKSLTGEGNDFDRKGEAMEEELPSNNHQGMEEEKNDMEIETHDILKQQEEMLKKKMNFIGLSVETKKSHDLRMQIEPKEINSEAKIHHKKSAADTIRHHEFRCLIFSPSISEAVFKRHLTIIYRGLIYARKCLKGPSDNYLKSKQVDLLARKQNNHKAKTLVLDLDETLIHSCGLKENPMNIIKTIGDFGEETSIGLNVRPFCSEFLSELAQYYNIFVFTASSFAYATAVLNFLDPNNQWIDGLLSRSNCMQTKNGFFIKDLRIIRNRNLKDIVIVDNLAHSFGFQIENGIPILEWHNELEDKELLYLKEYLKEAHKWDDMREFNKKKLKLIELSNKENEDLGF